MWCCRCDCGTERTVSGKDLRYGKSRSCDCLKLEQAAERLIIHRLAYHPQFHAWQQMRERCRNPRDPAYRNYGGRGITVCDRWQNFTNFLTDMGARPSPIHSLDRIDNNGNYEPGNCRWATRSQQNRNTRRNPLRGIDGERISWHQAADYLAMSWYALRRRLLSALFKVHKPRFEPCRSSTVEDF